MEIRQGVPTFAGIAMGRIRYYSRGEYRIRQYLVQNVEKELVNYDIARDRVRKNLSWFCKKTSQENPTLADLNARQIQVLEGGSLDRAIEALIRAEKVSAAYAVMTIRNDMVSSFGTLEDPQAVQRLSDVCQITGYLLEALGGVNEKIDLGQEPVILVADSISLTELMEMDQEKLLALVTQEGSDISHVSILSRSMGIPSMIGITPSEEWDGHMAIVDSFSGRLYLDPDEEELKEYAHRRREDEKERKALLNLRKEEDVTADGKEIPIYANIGNLADLGSVLYYHAAGIGMLRSECFYLGRESYPSEDDLFFAYRKVAQTMQARPVIVRTADLGVDKKTEYLRLPSEANPLMGNRGIRLGLERKNMLKTQLRAIYRAGIYGNLSIMYPMVTSLREMEEVEALTQEVFASLNADQIPFKQLPQGILVETPAAALIARNLAKRVDFLSLGTNDLTQFVLGMDRQNPDLRDRFDSRHPAVLRLAAMVTEAAHQEGKKVFLCGELAADTSMTETFVQMGIDALSVVPACILPMRKAIRQSGGRSQSPSAHAKHE